jgi:hypothetical protein
VQVRASRFDSPGLFRALEAALRERALSWEQLAAEAGVAVSTLKRTRLGGPMEADGVLAMLRVIGKVPEDFTPGACVTCRPLKRGRLNTQALYEALDARRREDGISWSEASREIGTGGAVALQRLANGGRMTADLLVACTWWLGRAVNDFVDPDFEHPNELGRRRSVKPPR